MNAPVNLPGEKEKTMTPATGTQEPVTPGQVAPVVMQSLRDAFEDYVRVAADKIHNSQDWWDSYWADADGNRPIDQLVTDLMFVADRYTKDLAELRATKQRDAWRAACRLLYDLMGEGGKKGRPMDALSRGDWGRVIAVIGKAESLDEAAECDKGFDCNAGSHSDACPVSA